MLPSLSHKVKNILMGLFRLSDFRVDSRSKAMEILGANSTNYKQRYKHLMKINHPDKGGSEFLCQKITESYKYIEESNKRL
ncbi:hypothetical protein NUSPORA_02810 [Nucleospora cyclopteri]